MKRAEVLKKAEEVVNGEREGQYGSPEDNFRKIADLWGVYLNKVLTPADVAHMMILLKIARAESGKYVSDNYVDICGYAACASEIIGERKLVITKETSEQLSPAQQLAKSQAEANHRPVDPSVYYCIPNY